MEKQTKKKRIVSHQVEQLNYNLTEEDCNCPEKVTALNCWGWKDSNEAACEIFNSLHSSLLEGAFVFGYKNTGGPDKSQLLQLIVVRFDVNKFGLGVVTSGYTMLLPSIPLTYLQNELIDDLKKWKLEKKILDTFIQILVDIENEITSN